MNRNLTESERSLIGLALGSSASQWREWSHSIARPDIAAQFGKQADEAEALASAFGGADAITVTTLPDQCSRLFNCCTGNNEPDWSAFVSLRLGACRPDPEGEGTEGLLHASEAAFFTVYGVEGCGMVEAITDTPEGATLDEARTLLAELGERSGLPTAECHYMTAGR